MFVMDTLKVKDGTLELGGFDVSHAARAFGTPLYLMDEGKIRDNCRTYYKGLNDYYNGKGIVLYASKALSCKYLYKIMKEEGLGVDVASGGELYTAVAAKFPSEKIYFHGNNKTKAELELAIDSNVRCIVVDNKDELMLLNSLAKDKGRVMKIAFRIKPGIDAHTHDAVMTGQIDSKFGVALETGEAEKIIKLASTLDNIKVVGVHCHIGSQIFDKEPFERAAEVMLNFIADLSDKHNIKVEELNLGGGFGIKYTKSDDPIAYDTYIAAVAAVVKRVCEERGMNRPFIVMEPGRSIVADAGMTVYTVGAVKEIPKVRTYVSVDGGMGDNIRYALYGSQYEAVLVNNPLGKAKNKITLVGKCCESGDVLIKDIDMPKIKTGDLIAVLATGAYNYSMASNYNRNPRPPIVMIDNKCAKLVVNRETYQDLIMNDM